jgi:hypothetical protein
VNIDIVREAEDFMVFCDGLEEAGLHTYARRGRNIARHLIDTKRMLDATESVTKALRERIERLDAILASRPFDATRPGP